MLETLTGDNNNVKSTITSEELTDEISTEETKINEKSEADDESHGNRLRELVVDNQLQEIVLKVLMLTRVDYHSETFLINSVGEPT